MEEKKRPHMEFRRVGEQDFMSKERDLNYWFQPMVRAALVSTENALPGEMTEETAREKFGWMIENLRDFYGSIMTVDASADELVSLFLTRMCEDDTGKIFMLMFARLVFIMYVDSVRRAVQKPGLSKDEIEGSLKAVNILSSLPKGLADQVRPYLKVAEGFGSFVPGMFKKEVKEDEGTES